MSELIKIPKIKSPVYPVFDLLEPFINFIEISRSQAWLCFCFLFSSGTSFKHCSTL